MKNWTTWTESALGIDHARVSHGNEQDVARARAIAALALVEQAKRIGDLLADAVLVLADEDRWRPKG